MEPRTHVGIDVGGTFTDLAMFDEGTGRFSTAKVPSSPPLFWPSVIQALEQAKLGSGSTTVLHGTTVHLNAFLERKGARLALVTTKGFRDVYEMRRGNRMQPYDMHFRYPDPLIPRSSIFEISERMKADGAVLETPDEGELESLAAKLRDGGYEAVAICLLHSYRNVENEAKVAAFLRSAMPDLLVAPSHEVCREWREYERTSTAVINGYSSPILRKYLEQLLGALQKRSETRLFLLQSNGGLIRAEDAGDKGVLSLLSGPVGGNVAGQALSGETGMPNLICIDMGGTSFEASLVIDGRSAERTEREIGGFPILAPMVDIHTIGAGGGSIAWNDTGALRVGPQSAGARPGPACYGAGGTEPTVTDANIALGRLEDGSAFGELKLDASLARQAITAFGEQFNLSCDTMAQGILDVINEQMANAIRTITVRRGIDPRSFALVAYGGAGPMHAADIARLLGIETIIVPRAAGAFSAWGMLQSDLIEDRAETFLVTVSEIDWNQLNDHFAALEEELRTALSQEGVAAEKIQTTRALDIRYAGQGHAITVELSDGVFEEADPLVALRRDFEIAYRATYGHSNPDEAIEAATLRCRAVGRTGLNARTLLDADEDSGPATAGSRTRTVIFDGAGVETTFVHRSAIGSDASLAGPLVVEEETCTTVVPPGFVAKLDGLGNLILTSRGAQ